MNSDEPTADGSAASGENSVGADHVEEQGWTGAQAWTADDSRLVERDRRFADAARALVPNIGDGHHWYDIAYRLLVWVRKPPRSKALSYPMRKQISDWVNVLYRYHDLDRDRAWSLEDPDHNLIVPADEHVTVPTLWVVELFPPSAAANLRSIVERYDPSANLFEHRSSATVLSQSRAGHGYSWFTLAEIKDPTSDRIVPDARIESLPSRFWSIGLTQIQLGSGLTAVVAQFHLTDDGASLLDREWHAPHEPRLRRQGEHLIADDRKWSAFSGTQRVRRQSHDLARQWMAEHCQGFFAQYGEPQPLMDLLVMERYNPFDVQRSDMDSHDNLRALGISAGGTVITSPQVPKLVLEPTELSVCPTLRTSRTWALWGNRSAASSARPGLSVYNGDSDTPEALGHATHREARDILIALSITELTTTMEEQYTAVRDTARTQHDSFSSHDLQVLRRQLLTLSIDLASLKDDVRSWWTRRHHRVPTFVYRYVDSDEDQFNLTEHLRSSQTDDLVRLSKADGTIRDILGTVATLGAARDTRWVGRAALAVAAFGLAVAVISLAVAVVTLLITSPGDSSIACHTWQALCTTTGSSQIPGHPPILPTGR